MVVLLVEADPDNSGIVVPIDWNSIRQVSSREKSTSEVERVLVPFVEIQVEEVARQVFVIWCRIRVRTVKIEMAGLKFCAKFFKK